ncbi:MULTISPECIES: hypothetical protein [unclassified Frigoribacterium]|uniref:hypothetical protein n=1 Tax=unclassified Frigoribacterium TaxID=2627005 RepID=UPI001061BBF6|nr:MULTISPECIES: hypothetical protein [unclassified Frigoribacterium]MBP1191656.1 hypothetical protein [Frigoribacterium sp. PvP032]TDT64248.1 hypothetical protein EDF20_1741 [Frigoribacterium sp. PhB116]TWX38869.1 hypothetical protein ES689_09745 [Frigoribacterium sp. ACAM 257]
MTAAVTADQASHGRTVITSRAVRRVVSAVTAEALDAKASDVSVELTDRDGGLTLVAKAPVRITPLGLPNRASGTLLDRLTSAQSTIRERVLKLTGTEVERVDLQITGAELSQRRRVS